MKKLFLCLLALVTVTPSATAQPEIDTATISAAADSFNALFQQVDLNTALQDRYAITADEYQQLDAAWHDLPAPAQAYLMNPQTGWADFASMVLHDLYLQTPWEDHVAKASRYARNDLSLTQSRFRNEITVHRARQTLVDLLQTGTPMVTDGHLTIPASLKAEAEERAGRKAVRRLMAWEHLINEQQHGTEHEKVHAVSAFFARTIRAGSDLGLQDGNDYWQSPIETLLRGRGDCDDFAMAHYVSLRLLGIPAHRLRIAIVRLPDIPGHSVVLYHPPGNEDPLVLDNMISDRLGREWGRITPLRLRMTFDQMELQWGLTEHTLTEFYEGDKERVSSTDPRAFIPAFATALKNAQRLLPEGTATQPAVATLHLPLPGATVAATSLKPSP